MISGETPTAIAMTEPGAGSDLQGIRTTAIADGDDYVVNGSKTYITNGQHADLIIVAAKTDPAEGAKGISLVLVEVGSARLPARPQPRQDRPARPGHVGAVLPGRPRSEGQSDRRRRARASPT